MEFPESQNSRDERIEHLWKKLDPQNKGELDFNGLKKGLIRIDHPLKNANDMLRDVVKAMDKNGDQMIQYEEFRNFVERTEKELFSLFHSIDRDHNGKLDKEELKAAFKRAGLTVPNSKLDQFFAEVDENHDGYITFDEWRNFLLFLPTNANPGLKAVLSYYSSTVTLNSEGDTSISEETLEGLGYFLAGAVAGAVSRTATAPLDRIKVYLIANVGPPKDSIEAAKQGNAVAAAKKLGQPLVAAAKELWKAGGMRSLFAGNGLNVLKVMPESAIKFGSYEAAKRALAQLEGHGDPQNINPYSKFVAGGAGGLVSQLFVYPIDTLKFRMQCETVSGGLHGNALIIETAKKMYRQGLVRTSYRGLTMGLIGMFPYSAIDLGTFEFLKSKLAQHSAKRLGCHEEDALPGSFATGCIGAFSGAFGASVVYPINLLRTRLQAQGTVLHPPTYTGIVDVAQRTIKNEGFRGLFKGITPNLLKVVPAVSITYVVYENTKKALRLR